MVKTVFFIRHGQTTCNTGDEDVEDCPLTMIGTNQVPHKKILTKVQHSMIMQAAFWGPTAPSWDVQRVFSSVHTQLLGVNIVLTCLSLSWQPLIRALHTSALVFQKSPPCMIICHCSATTLSHA